MLRELGRGIQKFGYGIRVVGACCLCLAAIIGTAAIDLVLIAAIVKHGGRQNGFLTGFLLGSLLFRSGPNHHRSSSLTTLFLASLITSAIAIILAVFLSVPMVGAFIALAWTVAFAVTSAGFLLEKLGEEMIERANAAPATSPTYQQTAAPRAPTYPIGGVPVVAQEPVMGIPVTPNGSYPRGVTNHRVYETSTRGFRYPH